MLIKLLLIEKNLPNAQQAVSLLEPLDHILICGVATSYEHSIELIEKKQPDIVLLELNMLEEQSMYISAAIKKQFPYIHIIIYTGYDYVPYFNQLIENGVSGMLYKTASAEELNLMLYNVLRGNTIIPLSLYRQIKLHRSEHLKHYWEIEMTPIEQSLLEMIDERYTNALIAKKIHASESSVEKYLRKLYDKLGVRNKSQAIERMRQDRRLRPIGFAEKASPHALANPRTEVVEHEHL